MSTVDIVVIAVATLVAGFLNAVAGSGSLFSFPVIVATGVPALTANVSNTLALWPGYIGGATAARDQLSPADRPLLLRLSGAAAIGGVAGSVLLLVADPALFDAVVPFLVLLAAGLLAVPARVLTRLREGADGRPRTGRAAGACGMAGVYGAYFGGGLGVVFLATLNAFVGGELKVSNAIKNVLSTVVKTVALVAFIGFGPINWTVVAIGAPLSLVGGYAGGRLASRLPTVALRRAIIGFSVVAAVVLFLR